MKNKYHIIHALVGLLLLVCFSSCKGEEHEYHSVNDKIEAESKNYQGTSTSSEQLLIDVNTIKIIEGGHEFLIPERKSKIKSFACTECHNKPLNQMQNGKAKKAHWEIGLEHANEKTMNCITCHDGTNMDDLTSITGKKIDFNLSYELCSQCHAKQFEDWKGGAHGKKVAGWAPPRASMTCVNCHDPHSPGFESRWPAQFNTQIEKERK